MTFMGIIKDHLKSINRTVRRLNDFYEFDNFNSLNDDFNNLNYHY